VVFLPWALYIIFVKPVRPDTQSALVRHGVKKGQKSIQVMKPLDVKLMKQVAHKYNATLNDLVMNIIMGTTRRYLELFDSDGKRLEGGLKNPPPAVVTCCITANTRQRALESAIVEREIGNLSVIAHVGVPLQSPLPAIRLGQITRITDRLKKSPLFALGPLQLKMSAGLVEMQGHNIVNKMASDFSDKMFKTVQLTNVKGPTSRVSFCGSAVTALFCSINVPNTWGVVSYVDKMEFVYTADLNFVDPQVLTECFEQEWDAHLRLLST